MKASPLTLAAAAVLWIGTMIGAYQFGHRQNATTTATTDSSRTHAADGTNTRVASSSRGGSNAGGRDGRQPAEKPLTAQQLLAQVKAAMRPGSMQNPMAMMRALALLDKLRPEDIPAALAEAEGMKDQQSKMMVLMAVLGKWGEQDGAAAMKYAEDHAKDNGMMGAVLKMGVVSSWAEKDPEAVWQWYQSHKEEDSGGMFGGNKMVLTSIFSSLMNTDPDAAFKRLGELDKESRTMALAGMSQSALFDETKRQALLDHIKAMPDAEERKEANQMLLNQWMAFAPDEAMAWAAKQSPEEQRELREQSGTMLMMTDPKKGAAFIMQGATAEEKPKRYSQVVSSWGYTNPDAAAQWLAEQGTGPELDDARNTLAHGAMRKKPAVALAQALAITDADKRIATAASVYQSWHATDAAAADKAISAAGLTAEQLEKVTRGDGD